MARAPHVAPACMSHDSAAACALDDMAVSAGQGWLWLVGRRLRSGTAGQRAGTGRGAECFAARKQSQPAPPGVPRAPGTPAGLGPWEVLSS